MAKATYRDAGVDLEAYAEAMSRLPTMMHRTASPRVIEAEGGFAGLFQLDFQSPLFARNYREPVLVACTDGVGTKLKVAQRQGVHNTVGIDLVAMCVNDCICTGAEPLFFLDYVALPKDDPELLEQIVEGISQACVESELSLLGGETAILPDVYAPGDYDLAGFCVGVVERRRLLDGSSIAADDVVIGLAASGLHSNGFSLVRNIVFEKAGLDVDSPIPGSDLNLGAALLTPTRLYARPLRGVLEHYKVKSVVHGIAHITGGGLRENIGRIVPDGLTVVLDRDSWSVPPLFTWLQDLGEVDDEEMERVFNLGVGLAVIVSPYYAESVQKQLDIPSWIIGRVEEGGQGVVWG